MPTQPNRFRWYHKQTYSLMSATRENVHKIQDRSQQRIYAATTINLPLTVPNCIVFEALTLTFIIIVLVAKKKRNFIDCSFKHFNGSRFLDSSRSAGSICVLWLSTPTSFCLTNTVRRRAIKRWLLQFVANLCAFGYLFIYLFQTSSRTAFLFNLFADLCGFRLMDYIVFFMAGWDVSLRRVFNDAKD